MRQLRTSQDADIAIRRKRGRVIPKDVKQAFEFGYLAALLRLRRELPSVWRARALSALTEQVCDREELADEAVADQRYASNVRGVRLVVLRCEAAATLLGWRKELPQKSRRQVQAAIAKLVAEAKRLKAA